MERPILVGALRLHADATNVVRRASGGMHVSNLTHERLDRAFPFENIVICRVHFDPLLSYVSLLSLWLRSLDG